MTKLPLHSAVAFRNVLKPDQNTQGWGPSLFTIRDMENTHTLTPPPPPFSPPLPPPHCPFPCVWEPLASWQVSRRSVHVLSGLINLTREASKSVSLPFLLAFHIVCLIEKSKML